MNIEHVGFQVSEPGAMGDWYVTHLGFVIKRSSNAPVPVRFIADASGRMMIEIYRNAKVGVPDYRMIDPLTFHLAFVCDEIEPTVRRLVAAGATVATPREITPAGDELAMLRDPWGVAIQLCRRGKPMI